MIVGIGVDLVAVARLRRALDRFGDRFARKILGSEELVTYAESADRAAFLARRFAAKEAASKALGTGMGGGIHFRQISTLHVKSGAPLLSLEGAAARRAAMLGVTAMHLSLSDEKDHAIALVVLESGGQDSAK